MVSTDCWVVNVFSGFCEQAACYVGHLILSRVQKIHLSLMTTILFCLQKAICDACYVRQEIGGSTFFGECFLMTDRGGALSSTIAINHCNQPLDQPMQSPLHQPLYQPLYRPLQLIIVNNHCNQPLRSAIATNHCDQPLQSTTVINHCEQPLSLKPLHHPLYRCSPVCIWQYFCPFYCTHIPYLR